MIQALKVGDQGSWKELFATWRAVPIENGRILYYPRYRDSSIDERWVDARRLIETRVCDARPVWISEVRTVATGTEMEGLPRIEEVEVKLEHIGLYDGEYRAFCEVVVRPWWTLQRRDGGPWRITTVQAL